MEMAEQMDTIAEYYKGILDYKQDSRYGDTSQRVYLAPPSGCWLVIEKMGENKIQARQTDDTGKIVAWDNYVVKNADIRLAETIRLSVSGRSRISFAKDEIELVEKYGGKDRRNMIGKLEILRSRYKERELTDSMDSLIVKLGRISDQAYTDIYVVGQDRKRINADRSVVKHLENAREQAKQRNTMHKIPDSVYRTRKGVIE